jgi:LDH2 family malate/lactate/ureidoglycolate dehydrogenase
VSATVTNRYRLDDLRRFATALGSAGGLAPARAQGLATHLLWYDAAGAAIFGIGTLPVWLAAVEAGRVDPKAAGEVKSERGALTVVEGQQGLPPLLLERAAGLAVEKARELGLALVRVAHIERVGSAAAVTAGIATGPFVGLVIGPSHLYSVALPSPEGLPVVIDSGLDAVRTSSPGRGASSSRAGRARRPVSVTAESLDGVASWASVLAPEGEWLVGAIAIAALESLATFHERVLVSLREPGEAPGRLMPTDWEAQRRKAHEHGLVIAAPAWKKLVHWAGRLGVDIPKPGNP